VARTQADVKLVTMDMLVMESTLPEIDPGQVAGIADGGDLLRGNLTDWEGRKAPSADMERSHGAMVAALGEMAGAVQRAVTGLESGDPGAAFSAAEAYKSAEADFSSACAALFGED
jgi:hypothetical protein